MTRRSFSRLPPLLWQFNVDYMISKKKKFKCEIIFNIIITSPFIPKLIFQLMAKNYPLPLLPRTDILHIQNFTI
jgi:hypothetical protein